MKRNALMIGAFVLTAIMLIVAGVIWLGGNHLFEHRVKAVAYFQGSVRGLYVGAPVTFRGVQIGEVESIGIEIDPATLSARVPVFMMLRPNALQTGGSTAPAPMDIGVLVKKGLRATLNSQSLVTGQTLVDLDFKPDVPLALIGARPDLLEIPTVKGQLESFIDQFSTLPLKDTVDDFRATLQTMEKTLKTADAVLSGGGREWALTAQSARTTLDTGNKVLVEAKQRVGKTLDSVQLLSESTRRTVDLAQPEIQRVLTTTREAAESAREGLARLAEMTAPGAPERADLNMALRDLSQAARSMRELTELLERQPNAIVFGKEESP